MTAHRNTTAFTQRPATEADVGLLTTLLHACTTAHLGRATHADEVRDRLGTPGCSLPTDTVIELAEDGTAVGFGNVWSVPPDEVRGFARVHPQWRGQGVGTRLAAWLVARASAKSEALPVDEVRVTTTAWAADVGAAPVFKAAGLAPVRHFLKLYAPLTSPNQAPLEPPADVRLRPYAERVDDAALFDCFAVAFAEHWAQEAPDAQRWWWDERDSPDSGYDPTLWSVIDDGARIVGFVLGKVLPDGEEGYVSQIGVAPSHRGRGLGRVLLDRIMQDFRDRRLSAASLDVDVDNTTSALQLYRHAGMTERPAFTIWGTTLDHG